MSRPSDRDRPMSRKGPGARQPLSAASVKHALGLPDAFDVLLEELSALEPQPCATRLPDDAETTALLARLNVDGQDAAEAVTALPRIRARTELWWLLERCRARLVNDMGGTLFPTPWPQLPRELGAAGRYFYLAVLLATLEETRRFHAAHGIPDEISWASLADLGEKVRLHRRLHGVGGLDLQDWLTLHFRGALYTLGRLQFNMTAVPAHFTEPAPGTSALGLHVPETGPMTEEACERSLHAAPDFFDRHFGIRHRVALCTSWLLDTQLAEYLPEQSNIVRFQRRFHLTPGTLPGDSDVLRFVFGRPDGEPGTLPRETALQRAVVAHLRAGRHWLVRTGWVELGRSGGTALTSWSAPGGS